jgi:hypothetical protein
MIITNNKAGNHCDDRFVVGTNCHKIDKATAPNRPQRNV